MHEREWIVNTKIEKKHIQGIWENETKPKRGRRNHGYGSSSKIFMAFRRLSLSPMATSTVSKLQSNVAQPRDPSLNEVQPPLPLIWEEKWKGSWKIPFSSHPNLAQLKLFALRKKLLHKRLSSTTSIPSAYWVCYIKMHLPCKKIV